MGGVPVVLRVGADLGGPPDLAGAGRQPGRPDHDPEIGGRDVVHAVGGGEHPLRVDERPVAEVGGDAAAGHLLERGHEGVVAGGRGGAADDAGRLPGSGGHHRTQGQEEGGEDEGRRDPRAHEAGHGGLLGNRVGARQGGTLGCSRSAERPIFPPTVGGHASRLPRDPSGPRRLGPDVGRNCADRTSVAAARLAGAACLAC